MTILAMETSTSRGSVAVLADGELLFEEAFSADRTHSASLFITLKRALRAASHLDQIAIGLGPGSYAGVRIAIAAGIGLQLGIGAALTGVPSVAALDTSAADYLVIGDARREAFYFTRVVEGVCVEGPQLLTRFDLSVRLKDLRPVPVFATAALEAFPAAQLASPSAALLARIAAAGKGITATGILEPIYLRDPHITTAKGA